MKFSTLKRQALEAYYQDDDDAHALRIIDTIEKQFELSPKAKVLIKEIKGEILQTSAPV